MHESSQVPNDERQADVFQRLIDRTGFEPKHLTQLLGIPRTTAYRIVGGDSPFGFYMLHDLMARHADPRVRRELLMALVEHMPVTTVFLADDLSAPTDQAMADALGKLADLFKMRAEHRGDGVFEPRERDEESRTIRSVMQMLHTALASLMSEPVTTRKQAKPLSMVGGGK